MDIRKNKKIQIRLTAAEFSKLKVVAKIYAGGNMSQYLLYAFEAAPRKYLKIKGQE